MNETVIDPFWLRVGLATAGVALLACLAWILTRDRSSTFGRVGLPFAAIVIAAALWAGVKPKVSWPTGIVDDGSCFDTNAWQWVELRWKLQRDFPRDVSLTIDAKPKTGDWFNLDVCLSGLLTNRIDLAGLSDHPTNYIFRVTSEYTPGTVEIKDFSATASTTGMAVVCRWTSPTNLVGLVGHVQYRLRDVPGATWTTVANLFLDVVNEVYVPGNFVNRRIDRDFRLVVDGYNPFMLINRTDSQLDARHFQRRLNFQLFTLPRIRQEMRLLWPTKLKGVRL